MLRVTIFAAIFVAGIWHSHWYSHFQPDDAFIYLVYVQSFFNGLGLTFNGQLVEGYSSVLWTALVTIFSFSGADPLIVSKWLGWSSYAAIAVMMIQAHRMVDDVRYESLISLLAYFCVPSLAMWAAGAMETVLFSALIALAGGLYYYGRQIRASNAVFAMSGFFFALVALTRPEGFALVGAVFAFEIVLAVHGKWGGWRGLSFTLGVYSLFTALMFGVRFWVYGKWFPATVGAKTGSLSAQMHHGQVYLFGFAQEHLILVAAYVLALGYIFLKVRKKDFKRYSLVWLLAILVFGYLTFSWLVGGDWMLGWRFVTPVLPFVVLTIGLALVKVRLWISVTAVSILVVSLGLQTLTLRALSVQQANSDMGDVLMGKYINNLDLAPNDKIAVIDAGAIPYYSGLPTIDMIGLNDSYLSSLPGGFMQKFDNDYVLANEPRVIQFHTRYVSGRSAVVPAPVFVGATQLFYSQEFQRWYKWDEKSPVPHLFLRREVPLANTIIDTFFDARIDGDYRGEELGLRLEKLGDGVWVSSSNRQIELGAVYVRVRFVGLDNHILSEVMLPIPNNMVKDDTVELSIPIKQFGQPLYKITACPVLMGVRDMEPCLNGDEYEYVITDAVSELSRGAYSFDDQRLTLSGWSELESSHVWTLGKKSTINFNIKDFAAVKCLNLQLMPFGQQNLVVELNGIEVYRGMPSTSRQVVLSVKGILKQKNELRLVHPDAIKAGRNDDRVIAFAFRGIEVE